MRKRSKYKPKGVRLDVMTWIKSGMLKVNAVSGSIITEASIKNHISIDALRKGEATTSDMDNLINAFNVAEALAIHGIGAEYQAEIGSGQDALYNIGARAKEKGRFVLTGPELTAINTAMQVHDAQLDVCTVAELEQALDYVNEQIRQRKTRRVPVPT